MIIKKITIGFVVQTFDTEKEFLLSQEFIAGDEVTYEDEKGEPLSYYDIKWWRSGEDCGRVEPYCPFTMVQPDAIRGMSQFD